MYGRAGTLPVSTLAQSNLMQGIFCSVHMRRVHGRKGYPGYDGESDSFAPRPTSKHS
jgi:hypothetical protein